MLSVKSHDEVASSATESSTHLNRDSVLARPDTDSVSLGISLSPDDGLDAQTLLTNAVRHFRMCENTAGSVTNSSIGPTRKSASASRLRMSFVGHWKGINSNCYTAEGRYGYGQGGGNGSLLR